MTLFECKHCKKVSREPQPEIVIPKCFHCGSKDVKEVLYDTYIDIHRRRRRIE